MLHDDFRRQIVGSSDNCVTALPDSWQIRVLILLDLLLAAITLLLRLDYHLFLKFEAVIKRLSFPFLCHILVVIRQLQLIFSLLTAFLLTLTLAAFLVLVLLVVVLILLNLLIDFFGITEVNKLDVVILVKHDIHRFEVSMHYVMILEQLNSVYHLCHENLGQLLSDSPEFFTLSSATQLVDQRLQVTLGQVLEDENNRLVAHNKCLLEFYYMSRFGELK